MLRASGSFKIVASSPFSVSWLFRTLFFLAPLSRGCCRLLVCKALSQAEQQAEVVDSSQEGFEEGVDVSGWAVYIKYTEQGPPRTTDLPNTEETQRMAGAQLPRQGTVGAGPTSVEGLVCSSVGSEWAWRGGQRGELGCVQVIVCGSHNDPAASVAGMACVFTRSGCARDAQTHLLARLCPSQSPC